MESSQDQEGGGVYRFGRFELRPAAGELRRGGVVVPLQRQPLRVLELLVSRAGEAVRRQEMFRAVWGEAVHVDYDRGLNYCIRRIRRALGDDVEHPLYVETLPRFGYRFIAPVTRLRDVGSIAVPGPVPTPASTRARLLRAALVGGAAAMLLVMTPVVAWWTDRRATAESGVPAGAFEHYLRGRHLLEQGDPAAVEGAVGALERAVAMAPDFARAHLALAGAYARLPGDREVAVSRSRKELRRAIELDDSLAAAHAQLADILLYNDWNFGAAEESLRRAITLQPDSAEILQARANFLSMIGRHDEAIEEIRQAMALDPVSAVIRADAAWYFYRARRYDEAIAVSRATLEVEPDNQGALWSLLQSRRQLGQSDAALDAARKLQAVLDPESNVPAELADFWRWYLAFNERGGLQQGASPSISGLMHLALGERERALDLFELATERRIGCVLTFAGDPQLDPIRDDPRFAALLNRMGLTG